MKSIMQNKEDHECYLCGKLNNDFSPKWDIEEHHVFFGVANRKLSEKFGLKVYLCGTVHHREGKDSVHKNHDICLMVQQDAQRAFEAKYPDKSFREIFGKNYVFDDPEESKDTNDGFRFIEV